MPAMFARPGGKSQASRIHIAEVATPLPDAWTNLFKCCTICASGQHGRSSRNDVASASVASVGLHSLLPQVRS